MTFASRVDRLFLAGGGEMGALMRTRDWSDTPLGEPDLWPQSLRTSVSTCLNCAFPILLWWGPELVMLYNDEYIPMLGAKHPAALGQTGETCWPEIWDVIGPMLRQVIETGEATRSRDLLLLLERKGFPEECYFSFSYSPIRVETGEVGGVFTPVIETTAKVIGERRLRTLRDLAAQSTTGLAVDDAIRHSAGVLADNPNDAPFAALYLAREDGSACDRKANVGLNEPGPVLPDELALSASAAFDEMSPAQAVIAAFAGETRLVDGLRSRLAPGALTSNPWTENPDRAVALPVILSGRERPSAVLIVGLSPRLEFDAAYQEFLQLVARQISIRLSDAFAYEAERKRAEALAEIDRAKTTFFSNVSHEFRTPLALMLGPLEDVLNADPIGPSHRERLELAHRNSLRLLKLVNTLLDFSRMEAGRVRARFEPTDLSALTIDLVSGFRSAIDKAGLELRVDCAPLPRPVYVDREMWEKVVLNLISNAFKFTWEGEIRVALEARGERAVLTVADTGVGIPEPELPNIFNRFHRIEGQRGRSYEGSGIGLAFVHELVRQHGGAIAVESAVGAGAKFTIAIPFGASHLPADRVGFLDPSLSASRVDAFVEEALRWLPEAHPPASQEDAGAAAPRADERGHFILIADDNADIRAYLSRLLRDEHEVATVANGEAALEAIRRRRPDLLVTDVMMPVLDGFGLLRAIRDDEALRDLPVILLTARAGEEARLDSRGAGADDFLTKPFTARELIGRVNANLALARMRADAARAERESAERLKTLFENAPAFMCLLAGPSYLVEMANEATRRLVGGRPLLGLALRDALPEVVDQGLIDLLDEVRASGRPYTARRAPVQFAMGPDGAAQRRFLDFVYQPVKDKEGAVTGVFVEGVDVTDHVESEAALGASETRYRTLIDALPQMVWTCRSDGNCDYVSPQWREYTGVPANDHLGSGWLEAAHPDDRERVSTQWAAAVAGRHSYDIEYRMRRRDGVYRSFKARGVHVPSADGGGGYWLGACTDIQEIVEARDILGRAKEHLEREIAARTHERDRLWRNSRDLLVVVDLDGVFRAANPAWTTVLGWTPEEVVGRRHLEFVHPDDRPGSQGALEIASQAPLPIYENRVRHKDGGYRWISWVAAPEDDLVYASGRHVTAEKEAAAELATAQEALRQSQKMEAIGQLTGGVAHDFNNLLTIIRSSVDLLRRREISAERQRRYIDAISDTVDRAAKMTGQLLAFSRRQPLSPAVFDLADRLANTTEILKPVLGSRIALALEIRERPALVEADINQFETAMINLAANARDAMAGEGRLAISLSRADLAAPGGAQDAYVVSVVDTGCGIPPENLVHIFEPFFTTKEVGRGTGLGLSQVYGFARQSGGAATVESVVGAGSTFRILLPRSGKPLPVQKRAETPANGAFRTGRVLVVEDNPEVGEFTVQLLDDLGFETTFARDAQHAFAVLRETQACFDLVLSDVMMPGMNGIEFAKELRKSRPRLPIVLMSGYSDALAVNAHKEFALVSKPFSVMDLSRALEAALGKSEMEVK